MPWRQTFDIVRTDLDHLAENERHLIEQKQNNEAHKKVTGDYGVVPTADEMIIADVGTVVVKGTVAAVKTVTKMVAKKLAKEASKETIEAATREIAEASAAREASATAKAEATSAPNPSAPGTKPSTGNRFVADDKGNIVDTQSTGQGSYEQPTGGRTDILQREDHGAGLSHTHEPKLNTDPVTGNTFQNGVQQPGRPVSAEDVANIQTGKAQRLPPRGR